MTEPKFTKGPWVNVTTGPRMKEEYTQPFAVVEHGSSNLICGCFGDVQGGYDVADANARLISAAPDLYEVLKDIVPRFAAACRLSGSDQEFIDIAVEKARAALAKADGGGEG